MSWDLCGGRRPLRSARRAAGIVRMGPEQAPGGNLVVGHFTDPEGNLIGVAGPA